MCALSMARQALLPGMTSTEPLFLDIVGSDGDDPGHGADRLP